jgi:hypothetical protein
MTSTSQFAQCWAVRADGVVQAVEGELVAVPGPRRLAEVECVVPRDPAVVDRARRQPAHVAAVAVHDIEVRTVPAARTDEDDPPVVRDGRCEVDCRVLREVRLPTREIDRDDIDVVLHARGNCLHRGGNTGR